MPLNNREVMRGSIVLYDGKVRVVKAVSELIMLEGDKNWIGASLMQPEPLADVWFERFGFTYDGTCFAWYKQLELSNWAMEVRLTPDGGFVAFQGFMNQWQQLRVIQHVHQLQGLFFYLFEEFLKLPKLPK